MFLTWLMLVVALCLSAIAAFYSIIGLTAIFAAAVIPVAVMGTILEIAKLTVTVWLHEYWNQCKRTMKAYLVPAVGLLMLITSMGIFGFLSKAHLDQAVPAGDISAQVQIYDEKIRTQRDNIESARAALKQMDAAVDQQMARSTDEQGAQRAANLRRQQGAERNRLNQDISRAQAEIVKLQEQRAPVAAQARKVEAEVGPIKYIAALIYGDNPDQNLLEKAVRWVIIILVLVFDPLAIFMLLAATESYKWNKSRSQSQEKRSDEDADVTVDTNTTTDMDGQSPGDSVEPEPLAPVVEQPRPEPLVPYEIIGDADPEDLQTLRTEKDDDVSLSTSTFGTEWPKNPVKGDQFIRTDRMPTMVYKYNGEEWIAIDKNLTDVYAHNDAYIDFLINKIASGEYDPELLNEVEKQQIQTRLQKGLE